MPEAKPQIGTRGLPREADELRMAMAMASGLACEVNRL